MSDFITGAYPVALPLVQGGRVRMLGVTTKERVEAIPDVPSLAEAMVAHGKLALTRPEMQTLIDNDFNTRMY